MFNQMNMFEQFMKMKENFKGDPKEEVMRMLNSGQISQRQLDEAQKMAKQFIDLMKQ